MLHLISIEAKYGPIRALKGVTLHVGAGEIVALLGANGAGKTTTLRLISGIIRPAGGRVEFEGERIDGLTPEAIVARGIVQVPEGRQLFPGLTVAENLRMGAFARRDRARVKSDLDRVLAYFPQLKERLPQLAGTLSGGEQQMLAIGRALMARPRLLLLDEPSMGLAPLIVRAIYQIIETIHGEGTTILMAEQNANMALGLAQRGYVLQNGYVRLEGQTPALRENPEVRHLYLGK